jgi:malate dehydrogenase (oxaloacetate-decarboxylating)(NADP+)
MVTGVTRNFASVLEDVRRVIDPQRGSRLMGMSIVLSKGRTIFIADTNVTEFPTPEELAQFAIQTAQVARRFGVTPRVAFMSHSTFGNPRLDRAEKVRDAVSILDRREDIDFEYDGEMSPEVALMPEQHKLYPFNRLTTKLLASLGGATVIGPLLIGLDAPIQIAPLGAPVSDIVTYATLAAFDVTPKMARPTP